MIKFIHVGNNGTMVQVLTGTTAIFLLNVREHAVQLPGQRVQRQARYSVIITLYFFDQATPYTLKTVASCFIPEITSCLSVLIDSLRQLQYITANTHMGSPVLMYSFICLSDISPNFTLADS